LTTATITSLRRLGAALLCGAVLAGCLRHEPGPSASPSWADALGELVLPLLDDGGDTVYAPGFREAAFRSLPLGADSAAARRVLGAPLDQARHDDGETYWYYSQHGPRSKSYFMRILVFSPTGRLSGKVASYYLA
jgi:hypothetical protein